MTLLDAVFIVLGLGSFLIMHASVAWLDERVLERRR